MSLVNDQTYLPVTRKLVPRLDAGTVAAYVWLMRMTTASVVGTHAYVNPIVAVALGAALEGERLTLMTIVSAITIVGGVILVLVDRRAAEPNPTTRVQLVKQPLDAPRNRSELRSPA